MDGIFAEMSMDVLRRRMADLTGVDLGGELELEAGDGLQIDWAGGRGKIFRWQALMTPSTPGTLFRG